MIEICKNVQNNWNSFIIVPQGHNNCQLSIVNCQFGEAAKFQFVILANEPDKYIQETGLRIAAVFL